jgi:Uma2 family endonuclease
LSPTPSYPSAMPVWLCWLADVGYGLSMGSALKPPAAMTVAEFLAWDAPGSGRWQLVDGEPVAMAPASRTHGALQPELGRLVGNHLVACGSPCTVIAAPGIIPRVRARENFRIPELAVTCTHYETEEYDVSNPVLIVEVLSPSNRAETWQNVWSYTTIPSLREILIINSTAVRAELLRRGSDGNWPAASTVIEDGDLNLECIGFTIPLAAIYRMTRLAV